MYTSIKRHAMLLLESGELVTAPAVITQMLRLQQVMSGHLKTDDGEMLTFPSTRMTAVLDIIDESDGKVIIWSRFRHDIIEIVRTLKEKYGDNSAASYFGDTTDEERNEVIDNFQNPNHPLRFFCRKPRCRRLWTNINRRKSCGVLRE